MNKTSAFLSTVALASSVALTPAKADEAAFKKCMENTLGDFLFSIPLESNPAIGDFQGTFDAITKRGTCYKLLSPDDPSYKTVMRDAQNWSRIQALAIKTNGKSV